MHGASGGTVGEGSGSSGGPGDEGSGSSGGTVGSAFSEEHAKSYIIFNGF